jgi:hypothetical protein
MPSDPALYFGGRLGGERSLRVPSYDEPACCRRHVGTHSIRPKTSVISITFLGTQFRLLVPEGSRPPFRDDAARHSEMKCAPSLVIARG